VLCAKDESDTLRRRGTVHSSRSGRVSRYMYRRRSLFLLLLCAPTAAFAQTTASLVDVSYRKPTPFIVSPGQIITLFFRGVGTSPGGVARNADAQTVPLPTALAGLSMRISQQELASPIRFLFWPCGRTRSAIPGRPNA
jgi:hypothetical protein